MAILATWTQFPEDEEFVVISGGARGADTHARKACEKHGIDFIEFPAQWDKFGRSAGPIRNQQMLLEGRPTHGLAFHQDLEKSKGTKDMVQRLKRNGVAVTVINY